MEECKECGEDIDLCKCEKCISCESVNDIQDNGLCYDCDVEHKDYIETVRTIN